MGNDIAAFEFGSRLGQDARDIERDIAHADHHRGLARKVGVKRGKLRVAIVPADKGRAAEDIGQVIPGQFERSIRRRAGCQHHRIVKFAQFAER